MPGGPAASPSVAVNSKIDRFSAAWMFVLALLVVGSLASPPSAQAKTPGTVHCYGGWCHRIHSVDEMDAMVGRRGYVKASYYDDCKRDRFNPCGLTSSGAIFHPDRPDNAASPIFPDGTVLLTYNPETRLAAVLRVTSAGPYRGDRTLDVSRATAEHLGFLKRGVAPLEVAILKSPEVHEARYSKLRTYPPVPGFLGAFTSFDAAHDAAIAKMQLNASGLSVATLDPSSVDSKSAIDRYWPRALAMDVTTAHAAPEAVAATAIGSAAASHARTILSANDGDPEHLILATHVSETDLPRSGVDLRAAFAGVIQNLRDRARPLPTAEPFEADDTFESGGQTLIERVRSFIRSAQVRARLGVSGGDRPEGYMERSWRVAID